ncbi:MAG: hypothetical protein H6673_07030 [Anaerolineales bacterium]|nr:hypothetical protein [Anaerolineales bacterium]
MSSTRKNRKHMKLKTLGASVLVVSAVAGCSNNSASSNSPTEDTSASAEALVIVEPTTVPATATATTVVEIATATDVVTETATEAPTETLTATATETATLTATATETATATPSPTATETEAVVANPSFGQPPSGGFPAGGPGGGRGGHGEGGENHHLQGMDTNPPEVELAPAQSSTGAQATEKVAGAEFYDGQYYGDAIQADRWGTMQVVAVIENGQLVDVLIADYPRSTYESDIITRNALPTLISEAIEIQDSAVSIVTRATDSSRAFIQSLESALLDAAIGIDL